MSQGTSVWVQPRSGRVLTSEFTKSPNAGVESRQFSEAVTVTPAKVTNSAATEFRVARISVLSSSPLKECGQPHSTPHISFSMELSCVVACLQEIIEGAYLYHMIPGDRKDCGKERFHLHRTTRQL